MSENSNEIKNIPAHQRSYYSRTVFMAQHGNHWEDRLKDFEGMSNEDRMALLQALSGMYRDHARKATAQLRKSGLGATIAVGDTVKVLGGAPEFFGASGTVIKKGRTRCLVKVPTETHRKSRTLYLYLSEVESTNPELPDSFNA